MWSSVANLRGLAVKQTKFERNLRAFVARDTKLFLFFAFSKSPLHALYGDEAGTPSIVAVILPYERCWAPSAPVGKVKGFGFSD